VIINDDGKLSKIFDANPRIGFLAFANALTAQSRPEKFPRQGSGNPAAHLQPTLDAAVTAILALIGDRAHCRGALSVVGILSSGASRFSMNPRTCPRNGRRVIPA